jgi:hypothetical protein
VGRMTSVCCCLLLQWVCSSLRCAVLTAIQHYEHMETCGSELIRGYNCCCRCPYCIPTNPGCIKYTCSKWDGYAKVCRTRTEMVADTHWRSGNGSLGAKRRNGHLVSM